ncbi:hypothetical protein [Sphingobacterium kyonggiense]
MKNYLIIISLIILLFGCSKSEQCLSAKIETESMETLYGCEHTERSLGIDLKENHSIVRSQAQFDELVTGSCVDKLDFEKYDLIIGKKQLSSGVERIDYDYSRDCMGKYELKVKIKMNLTSEAPNITFHALVPKLGAGETVSVSVEANH